MNKREIEIITDLLWQTTEDDFPSKHADRVVATCCELLKLYN